MATHVVPARSEALNEATWNAEAVFETREAWRVELIDVGEAMKEIESFPGTISSDTARLTEWFDIYQRLARRVETLLFYAAMATAVDSNDSDAIAMEGQARSFVADFEARTAFANPELLGMDEDELRSWIDSTESLKRYRHHIDDVLRQKPHYRSGEVEEVLGLISDPFATVERTFELLSSNDMRIEPAVGSDGSRFDVTQSNIESIKSHADREVRRTGMKSYADAYLSLRNTYAMNYIAAVKQANTTARIRGYDSVLEMKLAPNNLPVSVFTSLIDTFSENLSTWHRYWDVKRRILGLDIMRSYDIWAPMTDVSVEFTFAEAVETIARGMATLGSEYVAALKKGCLEDRWVDYAQNVGKRQGAFSYGTYDTHPCILMSFDGSINEVSTLTHELGHSMHSYFANRTQAYLDAEYSIFVAEVASNFNQAMVRASLFKSRDDRDYQLAVIQEAMDNIHRYFFIMPTLARFEFAVFEKVKNGDPLNADVLQELMRTLYAEGYGDTLEDDPERTSITWATFGHLYDPFYTFQYATGISAAHALCNRIIDGTEGAVDAYLEFLKAGNSVYPIEALAIAGVDMTSSEPVNAGFRALSVLVDRLESLIV